MKIKRFISLLLILCIATGILPAAVIAEEESEENIEIYTDMISDIEGEQYSPMTYSTDHENTWINTGDQCEDIVQIAITQEGYAETGDNFTKYNAWFYGSDISAAWCSVFIAWCANQAGIGTDVIPKDARVKTFAVTLSLLCEKSIMDFSEDPQPGDIIFFGTSSGAMEHVAIVIDYNATTKKVTFIGGNQSDKVSRSSATWSKGSTWGSQYVIGVIRPKYFRDPYLIQCPLRHSTYLDIKMTAPSTVWSHPADNEIYEDSVLLDEVSVDETLQAIQICQNTVDEYWYKVILQDGTAGYVNASDTELISIRTDDISFTEYNYPEIQTYGKSFGLKGKIYSEYNTIEAVNGSIGEISYTDSPLSTHEYTLSSSPVNKNLTFGKLAIGKYDYVISVDITQYYAPEGKTVTTVSETVELICVSFFVVDSGSTFYTVSYDANGGENAPQEDKMISGFAITISDVIPERAYHEFMGWSVNSGALTAQYHPGDEVVFDGDTTLYAVWSYDDLLIDWVSSLYTYFMGRTPDSGGLEYWTGELRSGNKTASYTVAFFYNSNEFKQRVSDTGMTREEFVTALYHIIYSRDPDEGGLSYWVGQLESGHSWDYVIQGFTSVSEFDDLCESLGILKGTYKSEDILDRYMNVTSFVARMYTKCLGRDFDEEGLRYWVEQLVSGNRTGLKTAINFFLSDEISSSGITEEEFVRRAYATLMDREPDEGGLAYWSEQLESGAKTRRDVINGFAYSDEFVQICSEYGIIPY